MTEVTSAEQPKGVLSVQVSALPIVAGTSATITLIIRNPFSEEIRVESIEAPSSEPLLPRVRRLVTNAEGHRPSFLQSLTSTIGSLAVESVSVGPLVAKFPGSGGRQINFLLEPSSTLTVNTPFGPQDRVDILAREGSHVVFDPPKKTTDDEQATDKKVIPAYQEEIASFELRTAHWLFVTPKVLDLHAVIRYQLGNARRSQVVPISLSIRPPLKSIMCGSIAGGILGFLARQLTTNRLPVELLPTALSVAGLIVMAIILSIVLSRQDSAKGFVTLEDFYGAFVIGVVLGYTGTSYFEGFLDTVGKTK